MDGHTIEVRNLDKLLFPDSDISKGDLIDYYRRISATALPHYRGRSLTMQRFPDGIGAAGFFQKDKPDHYPGWIESVRLKKEGGHVDYVLANDAATLVYLANQACITFHLSLSRRDRPYHPDRLVFDLDPSDDDFGKVRSTARRLKELLDAVGLTSYLQTTGSRGLHVVVPLDRAQPFDEVRAFARRVAEIMAARHPDLATTEQRKHKRGRAVFVDYLRNAYGQTAVAPYSVRAIEGAPIAMPLRWHELDARDLTAQKYSMRNVFQRLGQISDPWADIDRHAQSIERAARDLGGEPG
ncbi:MAG: non-homologous end-joining DNA ligase [Gammaproteobacteria bacterium]